MVRMAVEIPPWGYAHIRGALANLGHDIARHTVKRILHDHGIEPAPERARRTPWKAFLQVHGNGLAACDLFTVEVLTLAGLTRHLVFFVIELKTRRVTIAGIHPQPYGAWMEQLARNLTDPVEGCLQTASHLIHDRDPLYTRVFGEILTGGGVQPIRLPPKSPNLNAYAERFRPARSKRSVSVAWSRLARLLYASSSTSSSNITITRETIRAATTTSCSDRHLRSTRQSTLSGGGASADFSASTTERPHEGAADYLHLTGSRQSGVTKPSTESDQAQTGAQAGEFG